MSTPAFSAMLNRFERNPVFCHVNNYDLFRKWLDATWLFLDAYRDKNAFTTALDKYTFEEGKEFANLINLYVEAATERPYNDILGELFMSLEVSSVKAGQFFTPFPVCEMMARVTFNKDDFERTAKEKGQVTVCDPCVGSGAMLLAFAKVVNEEFGDWGLNRLALYGQDIDPRCVSMTRIQLRINGLDSVGRSIRQACALSRALDGATLSQCVPEDQTASSDQGDGKPGNVEPGPEPGPVPDIVPDVQLTHKTGGKADQLMLF
jgi:hypothetical protein